MRFFTATNKTSTADLHAANARGEFIIGSEALSAFASDEALQQTCIAQADDAALLRKLRKPNNTLFERQARCLKTLNDDKIHEQVVPEQHSDNAAPAAKRASRKRKNSGDRELRGPVNGVVLAELPAESTDVH